MAEYIERKAMRDLVKSIDWYSVRRGKLITGANSSENALYKANDIYSAIYDAPTADVAPVRHGRWLKSREPLGWNEVDCVACSACDESWILSEDDDYVDIEWNYCPNCGAKMDLEATND